MNLYQTNTSKMLLKLATWKMLVFFLFFCFSETVKGQEQPNKQPIFSINIQQLSLKEVFSELDKISDYNFQYSDAIAKNNKKFSFRFVNKNMNFIMRQISASAGLSFKITGQNVSIKPANKKQITGKVTDAKTGEPLIGVSISASNSKASTITDINGNFSLEGLENTLLNFSYIGYTPTTKNTGKAATLNVTMQAVASNLDEVVVVGYGAVKKKEITGSVGIVNMKDLSKAPVFAFDQALAGRIAGVQVSSMEDGQPGSEMNIVIRGAGSLTQSTQPLYVIDGVPMENPDNSVLNPDEIASISILKDASQTAIYGARGANGVIVIETKQGKTGKPVIDYKSTIGFDNVTKTMDMMSPYQFVKYELERDPASASIYLSDTKDLDSYLNDEGIDWQKQLFNTGLAQTHSLAMRGGSEDTKYSFSGSYANNEAIIINTGYQRYQARFKVDQKISSRSKFGININYTNQKSYGQLVGRNASSDATAINGYLLYSVWGYRPTAGVNSSFSDADLLNQLVDEEAYEESGIFTINPIINAKNVFRETINKTLNASTYLDYDFNKNLKLKITASYNNTTGKTDEFYNSKTLRGTLLRANNTDGINGSVAFTEVTDWINENTLTWNKTLQKKHKFNVVGGFTISGRNTSSYGFRATNLPNESLGVKGLSEGELRTSTSNESNNTLASAIGRINYDFKSRYYLTFTARADGSSKFPSANKWGFFPSAGFSWRMNKEAFLENLDFISDSKLRVSYGLTGNNRVSDFAYRSSLSFDDLNFYSYNNTPATGLSIGLGNEKLKWETVKQLDLGYDLGLFRDRINITADVYQKITDDMLLRTSIPGSSGFTSVYTNIGSIENKGLELTLNTVNIRNKNFSWTTNFNISFNKNKILSLSNGERNRFSYISAFSSRMSEEPMYIAQVGGPAALFYGLIWDGNYQYEDFDQLSNGTYLLKSNIATNGDSRDLIQPGDIKYKDLNEDGVIDTFDKTLIGNPTPKHTGGFSNNFTYKGLSLNVLFQWSYGGELLNANRIIFEGNPTRVERFNQFASYIDHWTPENQSNTLYRIRGEGPEVISSRTIEDGSYLRLKTVSLGYEFPKSIISKTAFNSLSLSVSAQNLITWTNYSGMDPEVSIYNSVLTPGFDFSAYPHARRISFGLSMTF